MKARQQAAWASGDFAQIATLIVPVAGHLSDAADLRAGSTVLDVACGRGNAALTAAPAERLDFDLLVSDVEEIPFPDHQFDAAVSVLGSVFAPDQRRAAAELVRVTRPGGTTALASWMSDGFIGAMFGTVAKHVPPPAGVASPMLWATEKSTSPDSSGTP